MREITVVRKRAFAGALLPYWIIVGIDKAGFMRQHCFECDLCETAAWGNAVSRIEVEELDKIGIRISNGEIKTIPVAEDVKGLFVVTMDGCVSNEIKIDDGLKTGEGRVRIQTKGGLKNLSYPFVDY